MQAVFVELPAFERYRADYLDEQDFQILQNWMLAHPESGAVIAGTGGLRKLRFSSLRRQKGKRSGLRIIYFWWPQARQFWLFTLYGKDEMSDLTASQKTMLRNMLKAELWQRRNDE